MLLILNYVFHKFIINILNNLLDILNYFKLIHLQILYLLVKFSISNYHI